MKPDPRLANVTLLLLAGRRLLYRQQHPPPVPWEATGGISSLLEASRRLPQRGPWDARGLAPDETPGTGLGALLKEARAWQARMTREGKEDHDGRHDETA